MDSHSSQGIFPTQGSSRVSCIAGRVFTIWATRENLQPWCIMSTGLTSPHVSATDQPLHAVTHLQRCNLRGSSVNVGNYCHETILDQWLYSLKFSSPVAPKHHPEPISYSCEKSINSPKLILARVKLMSPNQEGGQVQLLWGWSLYNLESKGLLRKQMQNYKYRTTYKSKYLLRMRK